MTIEEDIIKKLESMGLEKGKWCMWWIGDTIRLRVDNYSFNGKTNSGIRILYSTEMIGTVYSFKQGVKEIQKIIQKGIDP